MYMYMYDMYSGRSSVHTFISMYMYIMYEHMNKKIFCGRQLSDGRSGNPEHTINFVWPKSVSVTVFRSMFLIACIQCPMLPSCRAVLCRAAIVLI